MPSRTVLRKVAAIVAAAVTAAPLLGGCSSTPQPRLITVTFIRHAESEANAAHIIDTTIPGPPLTELGRDQAEQLAHQLGQNRYDGVYASSMLRSQQTAAPLARELGSQVQVLPGLAEINAGWFEGKPAAVAGATYLLAPTGWLHGDRGFTVPGSINGNEFNEAFTAAVQHIYDSGDKNPVAFSHGAAIQSWTLMNATNARDDLMTDHPLPNLGRVVITGSPVTGWKLVDWDGIRTFD